MRKLKKSLLATSVAAAAMLPIAPATAADWVGNNSHDWFVATNWNPAAIPNANTDVFLDAQDSVAITHAGARANRLFIATQPLSFAQLQIIGGGTLTTGNANAGTTSVIGQVSAGYITVSGSGSIWSNFGTIAIGGADTGVATVRNGAHVGTDTTVFGADADGVGLLTLSHQGTSWTSRQALIVGGLGDGQIDVEAGATLLSKGDAVIAEQVGARGMVTVKGDESVWSNAGKLTVGGQGQAWLNIENHAEVKTGTNPQLETEFVLGDRARGELSLRTGGTLSSRTGKIGNQADGSGAAFIDGVGSAWQLDGFLYVGYDGSGEVSLTQGGQITASSAYIALHPESSGAITIDGAGSDFSAKNFLQIGVGGEGDVLVRNGATLHSGSTILGGFAGSFGSMAVDNARWISDHDIELGHQGLGLLTVSNGGVVSNSGSAMLGALSGHGEATVDGVSSRWDNSGELWIGNAGTGALTIADGGVVTNHVALIGLEAGSLGQVAVTGDGSSWISQGFFEVAGAGTGLVNLQNGGLLRSGQSLIGALAGANGAVAVQGPGTSWISDHSITVGGDIGAAGRLDITAGGRVESPNGKISANGGTGLAVVDGAGSSWNMTQGLTLGLSPIGSFTADGAARTSAAAGDPQQGAGTLIVRNGGHVGSFYGILGDLAGARGIASVEGAGSTWTMGASLLVGDQGKGSLTVVDGAKVEAPDIRIGAGVGSDANGQVIVDGRDSVLSAQTLTLRTGTLTLSNDALLKAQQPIALGVAVAVTELNIGSAFGNPAVKAGMIQAPALVMGGSSASLNFNHTNKGYQFDTALSGSGQINAFAGHTRFTADSSGFGGLTWVRSGGALQVDGVLGGSMVVQSGGKLEGAGRLSGVSIVVDGTVAPGPGLAVLAIDGNLDQQSLSTYEADIDAVGHADRIAVSGSAELGGQVMVFGQGAPGLTYTLLSAGGGISGEYAGVRNATSTPFLDFSLRYTTDAVLLDVARSSLAFAAVGATVNQRAVGAGLDALSVRHPLAAAAAQLDIAEALHAFAELRGEVHADTRGALLADSRFVRDAVAQRLRNAVENENAAWGQLYGGWGRDDGDANAGEVETGGGGTLVGVDWAIGAGRLGLFGGAGRSSVHVDERRSKAESDNLHLGAYGGKHWGAWRLDAGLAYSRHAVSTDRKLTFGGINERLQADYDARTVQAFAEAAYRIDVANGWYEPYLNLAQASVRNDAYVEFAGAGSLAGEAEDTDIGLATFGVHGAKRFQWGGKQASLRGTLGWRHAFGDEQPLSHQAFAATGAFVIAGAPIERDVAVFGAQLDVQLSARASLGLGYDGQLGRDSRQQDLKAQLQVKF